MHKRNHLHHLSHKIKHYLSLHISLINLKRIAFIIALLSCLVSGSILLFALFSTSFHEVLGLSYLQINSIASFSACGMYLFLPILGYLADCYGPALLSVFSIWFFCPAYFINTYLVQQLSHQRGDLEEVIPSVYIYSFCFTFCLIGLATSSLYFSSLLTCARIFPNHKGMAISLPVTCYGLSALMGSQILKLSYFHLSNGLLDLFKVFKFFGVLYLIIGLFSFISSSIVVVEQELIFDIVDEETALLSECSSVADLSISEIQQQQEAIPITPQVSKLDPPNHHERFMAFLKDPSTWVLLLSLMLNIGPLESFQNNLGSILKNISPTADLSNQVSLMAAASTVTRLIMGWLSDFISSPNRKYPICRVWLLIGIIGIGIFGQYSNGILDPKIKFDYGKLSLINGIAYGGLFTIYPIIVADVWSLDILGSTWSFFMIAPATGSILFSLLYGSNADSRCTENARALFNNCLSKYFTFTSLGLTISCLLVYFTWRFIWYKRGLSHF
ncbi:MCH1 [[Candida] subhashii]|uniref:MCH1 n=1 Tax=[Candida] subhashii TaxID=561895 RepID=A0A8J5QH09_9ASCO|nr:MCH1 [[Candida] subhashii]KAG7661230.1 MCH1 [[Candida] subhashii]